MTPRRSRKTGRPPAGLRDGEMVRDYPQLSVRLPPETRTLLNALTTILGQPQWRIINDAVESYVRERADQNPRLLDVVEGAAGFDEQKRMRRAG